MRKIIQHDENRIFDILLERFSTLFATMIPWFIARASCDVPLPLLLSNTYEDGWLHKNTCRHFFKGVVDSKTKAQQIYKNMNAEKGILIQYYVYRVTHLKQN